MAIWSYELRGATTAAKRPIEMTAAFNEWDRDPARDVELLRLNIRLVVAVMW
jgi:hypothetical protein